MRLTISKKIFFISLKIFFITFIILINFYGCMKSFQIQREIAETKAVKIIPAFCKECLPDSKIISLAKFKVDCQYPANPEVKSRSANKGSFHPLLTLEPYLTTLDNRAMLNIIYREVDGKAIADLVDWLESSGHLIRHNGMILLQYPFPIENVPAPFISSMAQAELVYLASVSYVLTGRKRDIDLARGALASFEVDYRDGGVLVMDTDFGGNPWYLEYANPTINRGQLLFVLNGFVHALHILAKTMELNLTEEMPRLPIIYRQGLKGLKDAVSAYELPWGWSMYDRTGENRATAGYHLYQSILLKEIATREEDSLLSTIAGRWISFYTYKLPYLNITSSSPKNEFNIFIHFKGIYPHSYLSEEGTSTFLYESDSGKKKAVRAMTTNSFNSTVGNVHFSQNVEFAEILSKAKKIQVWWENDWLGLPSVYKMFDVDNYALKKENISLGRWISVNDLDSGSEDLKGLRTNRYDIIYSKLSDRNLYQSWLENPKRKIRLKKGFMPSRQILSLKQDQLVVGFRGKYGDKGPGKSWHTIKIIPAAKLSGYQANRVLIQLKRLNINPSIYPYMELPLLVSQATSVVIAAVLSDGSRIARNFPINDSRKEIQKLIINWESFPRFQNKPIHKVDIRIILPEDNRSDEMAFCTPTLVSGVEGFLSILDCTAEKPGVFLTELNHNTRIGLPAAYFKMLFDDVM